MMELKGCPFCGVVPHITTAPDPSKSSGVLHSVHCQECGQADAGYWPHKETAIRVWNTRHDDWQEIALAPRDGTAVDLWGLGERHAGCHFVKCEVGDKDGWWENNTKKCAYSITFPFTHFRHVPQGPGEGR